MRKLILLIVTCSLGILFAGHAQTSYQLPPKEILELADTKAPSSNLISPKNSYLVQLDRPLYKSLEELAEPELKLAGLRFNPRNFNASRGAWFSAIKILTLPDAKEKPVTGLPANARFQNFSFSPDETHLAFVEIGSAQLKLWLLNLKSSEAKPTAATDLNSVMGGAYTWSSDGKSL